MRASVLASLPRDMCGIRTLDALRRRRGSSSVGFYLACEFQVVSRVPRDPDGVPWLLLSRDCQ